MENNWSPLRKIVREGKEFVYVGDIPNDKKSRENAREFNKEQGRETVFVADKSNKKKACAYISVKYYRKLANVMYPSYGTNVLK